MLTVVKVSFEKVEGGCFVVVVLLLGVVLLFTVVLLLGVVLLVVVVVLVLLGVDINTLIPTV